MAVSFKNPFKRGERPLISLICSEPVNSHHLSTIYSSSWGNGQTEWIIEDVSWLHRTEVDQSRALVATQVILPLSICKLTTPKLFLNKNDIMGNIVCNRHNLRDKHCKSGWDSERVTFHRTAVFPSLVPFNRQLKKGFQAGHGIIQVAIGGGACRVGRTELWTGPCWKVRWQ